MLIKPIPRSLSSRYRTGFSLVEMAIVLVLMSIMLTLGVAALNVQQDNAAVSATQRKMEIIKESLIAHLRDKKRLPCPETTAFANNPNNPPSGREGRTTANDATTTCQSFAGTLPWLELGLPRDMALDGHEHFFTYYVSSVRDATENNRPDWTRTANASAGIVGFNVGNPGRFAITEKPTPGPGIVTTGDSGGNAIPALAAVVLVSHGKNGFGAFTAKGTINAGPTDADEIANVPPTAETPAVAWTPQQAPYDGSFAGILAINVPAVMRTFVVGSRTDTFDDLVMVLRPNDLLAPIFKDGAMKSAAAEMSDKLQRIRNSLFAYAFSIPNSTYGDAACTGSGTLHCRLLPYPATNPATGLANSLSAGNGFVPWAALAGYGLAQADAFDPWGNPIRYSVPVSLTALGAGNGLSNSMPASGAITLASDGPNHASGDNDDIVVTISLIELRAGVGTANLP